jgi:hypothetical protein
VYAYNTRGWCNRPDTAYLDNAPPSARYTITCEYDAQGNRTKVRSDNPAAPTETLFEYKDGNCIKATYQAGTPLEYVYEYEYYLDQDNKLRTSHSENAYTRNTPNRNQLKKATITYKNEPTYRGFTDYSYEFNAEGFPVKITSAVSDNYGTMTYFHHEVREYACP